MTTLQVTKFAKNEHNPILVLLHGWGSSSKIWQPCIAELSSFFKVWCIDLPGHGENQHVIWDGSVAQGIKLLHEVMPSTCSMLAWSLGGSLAQCYCQQYPQKVENLMLVASIPKFVASDDWLHAMPKQKFAKFCESFTSSQEKTMQQFFALQSLHGLHAKKIISSLSQAANSVNMEKISWGLRWLEEIDLRNTSIQNLNSVSLLVGENDQVVPIQAAEDTKKIWPQLQLHKVSNAGHLPFLSHPETFIEFVRAH